MLTHSIMLCIYVDVEQSQHRTRRPLPSTTTQTHITHKQRSESMAIGNKYDNINDTVNDELNTTGVYGTSYTNQKTAEYELLNNIMRRTQYKFIDIGNDMNSMMYSIDESIDNEKYRKYLLYIDSIEFDSYVPPTQPNNKYNSTALLQYNQLVSVDDIELISAVCENVSVAISDIHMRDVGKFVLSFDEL